MSILPGISDCREIFAFEKQKLKSISFDLNDSFVYAHSRFFIFCLRSWLDFITGNVLYKCWLDNIRQRDMREIRGTSKTKLAMSGTITFHLQIVEPRTRTTFDVVDELTLPVLFGTTFIDKSSSQSTRTNR